MPEETARDLGQGKDQIDENSRQQKLAAFTRPATYEIHENATNCAFLKVGKGHSSGGRLEVADL